MIFSEKATHTHRTHKLFTWVMSVLLLGTIAYILLKYRDEIIAFPWAVNWKYLFMFFIVQSVAVGSMFLSWHLIVKKHTGFNNYTLSFKFYCLSTLAKRLPTILPYVSSRLILYRQIGISSAAIINCLVLENLLIGIGGMVTFLSLSPFYSHAPPYLSLVLAIITFAVIGIVLFNPRLFTKTTNWVLYRLHKEPLAASPKRRDLFGWIGLYIIPWALSGVALFLLPKAFSSSAFPSLLDVMGIATASSLIAVVNIILPGSLGVKEIAASALLSMWVPLSVGLVISLLWRLLNTLIDIIWTLFSSMLYRIKSTYSSL
jgi:uncharacterized membrane protein YbhN (UPF0104 family)